MDNDNAPLVLAGNRIRETAKWLTVSLAAVGAILVAGTQFSSIGSLAPGSLRFTLAAWGAGVAAVGTLIILLGTVWTSTVKPVQLSQLVSGKPELADKALLQGWLSVESLSSEYGDVVAARKEAVEANVKNPSRATAAKSAGADMHAGYVAGVVHNVMQVGTYYKLARTWRKAAWIVGGGSVVAAAGLLLFIWAANPPAAAEKSLAAPAAVGEVALRTVMLTAAGQGALQSALGAGCDAAKPLSVLYLSPTDSGADVLVQTPGCNKVRFLVTPQWGIVGD